MMTKLDVAVRSDLSVFGTLDFGDVPTWIATLGAIVAGIAAWRVFSLERHRDLLAEANGKRLQAEKISAWAATPNSSAQRSPLGSKRVIVFNGSDLPVYAVSVVVTTEEGLTDTTKLSVLAPGEKFQVSIATGVDTGSPLSPQGEFQMADRRTRIDLSFRDSANRLWARDSFGLLRSLD